MAGSFELIFERFEEGVTLDSVKEQLITDFEINPTLLEGVENTPDKTVTLLNDIPHKTAMKYQAALLNIGLICKLELITNMSLSLAPVTEEVEDNSPTNFTKDIMNSDDNATETFFQQVDEPPAINVTQNDPPPPIETPPIDLPQDDILPTIDENIITHSEPPPELVEAPPPIPTPIANPPPPSAQSSSDDPPSIPPSELVTEDIVMESPVYNDEVNEDLSTIASAQNTIESVTNNYSGQSAYESLTPPRKKAQKKALPLIIGASSVVIIGAAIASYFLFFNQQPSTTTNTPTISTPKNTPTIQQTVAPDNSKQFMSEANTEIENGNFTQAIDIIKKLKLASQRNELLQKIAQQQIETDALADAVYTTKQMGSGTDQSTLLSLLAIKYADNADFTQAKALHKLIKGYTLKTATASKIAIAETKVFSTKSREQAQLGNKKESTKNFNLAIRRAENINDLDGRISAFKVIAIDQAKINNTSRAEDTITFIEKVDHRAKTLSEVASIIAHNGDTETAKSLFKRAIQGANRIWDAREKSKLIEYIANEREAAGITGN